MALSVLVIHLAGPIKAKRTRGTLLVLGRPFRFRGDVELLGAMGFRVLGIPWKAYVNLASLYWEFDYGELYIQKESFTDKKLASVHAFTRDFLESVASVLKKNHEIDCVISPALHYRQDLDWGTGFQRVGVPYVVIHRENTSVASNATNRVKIGQWLKLQPFEGDLLIVHNRDMLEELSLAGYAKRKDMAVLGAMRMDNLKNLQSEVKKNNFCIPEKPHITFFSFHLGSGLGGTVEQRLDYGLGVGFDQLFQSVHRAIGEFATENPQVDVTVKAKWGGNWQQAFDKLLADNNMQRDSIPNLKFDYHTDPHELILKSHGVVAFQSTTALEAGMLGRQVVWPNYAEAVGQFQDYILFQNTSLEGTFCYVDGADELKDALARLLTEPDLWNEERVQKFEKLFEKYISPLDGDICNRYASTLDNLIHKNAANF